MQSAGLTLLCALALIRILAMVTAEEPTNVPHHSNSGPTNTLCTQDGIDEVTVQLLQFPESGMDPKRKRRSWILPPIKIVENDPGPFPKAVAQVYSNRDNLMKIHYSLTGPGADIYPENLFIIDQDSGIIGVTQSLDRETKAQYVLLGHAMDLGSGKLENPIKIVVEVIDQNDNRPYFVQEVFRAEILESSPIGSVVVTLVAKDEDEPNTANSDIRYSIVAQDPKLPHDNLFIIDPVTGVITVNTDGLDREKCPQYTLDVQVADMSGLAGQAKVMLTLTDINDNPPAFTEPSYEATIAENKIGAEVVRMSVIDADEPRTPAWNAKFTIIDGDPEGFFKVEMGPSKDEGIVTTAKGLDFEKAAKYTLLVAVENEVPFATDLPTATTTVVVNVQDVNEAPVFNPPVKLIVKREDMAVDSELVQYTATDPDTARKQKVMYKTLDDPAGWLTVHKETGLIKVKSPMDRESLFVKDGKYTALVGVYDNDEVPATGTGTLEIQLEDVNDNAPTVERNRVLVCNENPAPQLLRVTDKDGPGFTSPYKVSIQGKAGDHWTAKMNDNGTGVILTLTTELLAGVYEVTLIIADNLGLEGSSTVLSTVLDCSVHSTVHIWSENVFLYASFGIMVVLLVCLACMYVLQMTTRPRHYTRWYYYPYCPSNVQDRGECDQGRRECVVGSIMGDLDNPPHSQAECQRLEMSQVPAVSHVQNQIELDVPALNDSVIVFHHEGDGSDAGTLSNLSSNHDESEDFSGLSAWISISQTCCEEKR